MKIQNYLPRGEPWDYIISVVNCTMRLGYIPNGFKPRSFNEHILAQKLKFTGDLELAKILTGKDTVKHWLRSSGYEELIIETLLVSNSIEELSEYVITAPCVVKSTHGSGEVIIKRPEDKHFTQPDIKKMRKWLDEDYYIRSREKNYKGLPRKIIIEELLTDSNGGIPHDYKLLCYNGRVFVIQVDLDRFGDHKRQLFTRDWSLLPYCTTYPKKEGAIEKPPIINRAIELAENFSKPFKFCRVDFYILNESELKLGEFTFIPANAAETFIPKSGDWDCGELMRSIT